MNHAVAELELANELLHLHESLITKYRRVLLHPGKLDIKTTFSRIVEECMNCRSQLIEMLDDHAEAQDEFAADMLSLIVTANDRKTILAFCANNVRELMDMYSQLLSQDSMITPWKDILFDQFAGVGRLYAHIQQLHDAQ